MGYTSTAEGAFKIDPPLSHQELKAMPDLEEPYGDEIVVVIHEEIADVDGGELIKRTGTHIRPKSPGEGWKRYYTAQQLARVVESYPDHTFTGYFEFLGEDGARWRTVVKDGKVVDDIKPELRWPDL